MITFSFLETSWSSRKTTLSSARKTRSKDSCDLIYVVWCVLACVNVIMLHVCDFTMRAHGSHAGFVAAQSLRSSYATVSPPLLQNGLSASCIRASRLQTAPADRDAFSSRPTHYFTPLPSLHRYIRTCYQTPRPLPAQGQLVKRCCPCMLCCYFMHAALWAVGLYKKKRWHGTLQLRRLYASMKRLYTKLVSGPPQPGALNHPASGTWLPSPQPPSPQSPPAH